MYVYPDDKSEWLEGAKIEAYKPDEFGGNSGYGISISFFEVRDLIKAATAFGDYEGYNSVEEWLEENGLQMMQDAMQLFEKRCEELRKKKA